MRDEIKPGLQPQTPGSQNLLDEEILLAYIPERLFNHLVIFMIPHSLDTTFAALADPTRRAILARLALGEATVMELAEPFAMTQPAISKHIKVLEKAGLISRGRDAQRRPCKIKPEALNEAMTWLEEYRRLWEANYERLDALLDELKRNQP